MELKWSPWLSLIFMKYPFNIDLRRVGPLKNENVPYDPIQGKCPFNIDFWRFGPFKLDFYEAF